MCQCDTCAGVGNDIIDTDKDQSESWSDVSSDES